MPGVSGGTAVFRLYYGADGSGRKRRRSSQNPGEHERRYRRRYRIPLMIVENGLGAYDKVENGQISFLMWGTGKFRFPLNFVFYIFNYRCTFS